MPSDSIKHFVEGNLETVWLQPFLILLPRGPVSYFVQYTRLSQAPNFRSPLSAVSVPEPC